jgi:hypothetical protein
MDLTELEEALADILPAGFRIATSSSGQLLVFTGLKADSDGELFDFDEDDDIDEDLDLDADESYDLDEDE